MFAKEILSLSKELANQMQSSDFGKLLLQFILDLPKNKPTWVYTFAKEHNLDLNQDDMKERMRTNTLIAKTIYNDNLLLINIRSFSKMVIEVDCLSLKGNVILYIKLERISEKNFDLRKIILFPSYYRLEQKNTLKLSLKDAKKQLYKSLNFVQKNDSFSGNVLIMHKKTKLFEYSGGYANLRYKVKNNLTTKFNLGSLDKIFTAVAIMQLYEKKQLKLHDKIEKYLPDFPNGEKITIHQLLTHTSGLGSFWTKRYQENFIILRSIDTYLNLFRENPLLFEPGEKFEYSNFGYIVLGKIIEVITGEKYDSYVKRNIFDRAEMMNTGNFEIDYIIPNLAIGYTHTAIDENYNIENDDENFDIEKKFSNIFIVPVKGFSAGGGYSTVEDLANFALALETERLISKSSLNLMLNPSSDITSDIEESDSYGYGCMIGKIKKKKWYGHGGGANGIATMLEIFPEENLVVVILTNYDPMYEILIEEQINSLLDCFFTKHH
ncbi:MAG TPA: serine hydrolase domain-containing protein [candidate division Zixibacteria bacterium]|nr:serine hydrolase domain-containing protein [candidate division Zixibacteria bacterium]